MKALVYTQPFGVAIQERPYPHLPEGEEQVLIRIAAAGICGSDMHAFHGKDPRRQPGLVLGHELSGEIVESQSRRFHVGQRVTANPLITCGQCEYCLQGRDNLCSDRHMVGMDWPGAFAEFMAIPARSVVAIPSGLDLRHAAITEPAATVVHALRLTQRAMHLPLAEAKALVIGGGAIGLLTLLVLRAWGCRQLTLAEVNPLRRKTAELEVDCASVDPLKTEMKENSFDLVIDAVGATGTRRTALSTVRPGGTVMHIGLQGWESEIDMRKLTLGEITLLGTYTYTMADFCLTLSMLAQGALGDLGWVEARPLNDGQRAFDDLENQRVSAAKLLLVP
ncbi:alcohol dehydrogenase catalytic domain-containing protein [Raoultella terrigena]|uniref:alcohol dehydrogenase catalytic domain-containing protein n=1 Tax=Raoultella terrigena TaxID=577 RepID=UPI000F4B1E8F|nr:alcohol dehydrogenase catalytic domain-containing protein [Raoultella terrigena]ROR94599.1 alcohol dehydrogenase [Raoultella terrigena]